MVSQTSFQLKGSGWYVTDFRNGNKAAAKQPAQGDGKSEPTGGAESGQARSEDTGQSSGDATESGGTTSTSESSGKTES